MITIEEVQSIKDQFLTDGITPASGETLREVCDLALSQHQEIERLRAALQDAADCFWNNALDKAARKTELALIKSGEPK